MLHRRLLFLLSLPTTAPFQQELDQVSLCLSELRHTPGVTVSTQIDAEVLGTICQYDVVIIVAHLDSHSDTLELQEGPLPLSRFVAALPPTFSGFLDLSLCHSISLVHAIKAQCPQCHVQATLSAIPLLGRLLLYPQVVQQYLQEEEDDYPKAYAHITDLFYRLLEEDEALEIPDTTPSMTHLGRSQSSLYAPDTVSRNTPFWVSVFFSYDRLHQCIDFCQSDGFLRDQVIRDIQLQEGDSIEVRLDFYTTDPDHIQFCDRRGPVRSLLVAPDTTRVRFPILVTPEFAAGGFLGQVTLSVGERPLCTLEFDVHVAAQSDPAPAVTTLKALQTASVQPHETLSRYLSLTDSGLLTGDRKALFLQRLHAQHTDNGRLEAARRYLIEKQLLQQPITDRIAALTQAVAAHRLHFGKHDDISLDLLSNMSQLLQKATMELQKALARYQKLCSHSSAIESYVAMIEPVLLDITDSLANLSLQLRIIDGLRELKTHLSTSEYSKAEIKETVSDITRLLYDRAADKVLFDTLSRDLTTKNIWATRSNGVPQAYLALFIAMMQEHSPVVEDWHSNRLAREVTRYIDNLYRKNEIDSCGLLKKLREDEFLQFLRHYRRKGEGRISVSAYYISRTAQRLHESA